MSQASQPEQQVDPRIREALSELQGIITTRYPTAQFAVSHDDDEHANVLLITTVDVDNPDEVVDLVLDRMLQLQVEERIPVYVIPIRTPARIAAAMQVEGHNRRPTQRIASGLAHLIAPSHA